MSRGLERSGVPGGFRSIPAESVQRLCLPLSSFRLTLARVPGPRLRMPSSSSLLRADTWPTVSIPARHRQLWPRTDNPSTLRGGSLCEGLCPVQANPGAECGLMAYTMDGITRDEWEAADKWQDGRSDRMHDAMSRLDEIQESEEKSEINRQKADAMRCIEEMPDDVFMDWWERHAEIAAAATRLKDYMVCRGQS